MFTIKITDSEGNDHATEDLVSFSVGAKGVVAEYTDGSTLWFPEAWVEFHLNTVDLESLK